MKSTKIIAGVLIALIVILVGNKYLCEMLTMPMFRSSDNQRISMSEGFFVSNYLMHEADLRELRNLQIVMDSVWAEKSWGYDCTLFGKVKVEYNKNNLIFPVRMNDNSHFYMAYSIELDSNHRDFTSGYDMMNHRYVFSPSELRDTLSLILYKKDSVDGWKQKNKIRRIALIKTSSLES